MTLILIQELVGSHGRPSSSLSTAAVEPCQGLCLNKSRKNGTVREGIFHARGNKAELVALLPGVLCQWSWGDCLEYGLSSKLGPVCGWFWKRP